MSSWLAPGSIGRRLYFAWGIGWFIAAIVGLATGSRLLTVVGLGCSGLTAGWFLMMRNRAPSG